MSKTFDVFLIISALFLPLLLPTVPLPESWTVTSHTLLQTFSIVFSAMIFVVGWFSYKKETSKNVTVFASLFLSVGLLDLAHMLSYKGVTDFAASNSHHPSDIFGMGARLLAAGAFLGVTVFPWKPFQRKELRYAGLVTGLAYTVLMYWIVLKHENWLPHTDGETDGFTPFKLTADGTILILYIASALAVRFLTANHTKFNSNMLFIAILFSIAGEASFWQEQTALQVMFGHACKVAAYVLMFRAIFWDQIRIPYSLLQQSEQDARSAKDRLQTTLDSIYDSVLITDSRGIVTFANPAATVFFNRPERDMLRMPVEAIFKIKDYEHPVRSCLTSRHSSGVMPGELFVTCRDRWVSIEYSVSPIAGEQGDVIGTVLVFRDVTERTESEKRQKIMSSIIEAASDFIAIASVEGKAIYYNKTARTLLGLPENANISNISIGDTHPLWAKNIVLNEGLPRAVEHGIWSGETAFLGSHGKEVPVSQVIVAHKNAKNELEYYSTIARSLSDMKLAEKKDRLATKVFENITEGIMVTGADQVIQYINPAFTSITGFTENDIVGATPRILSSGKHTREFYKAMWEQIHMSGRWQGEVWNKRKSGEIYLESITITAVKDKSDNVVFYIAVFKDITVQKQLEEQLQHRAYHDTVTGLPNRLLLNERIEQAMRQTDQSGQLAAILFLDLDRFKRINDTLGHSVGDQLLTTVAGRLTSCLRGTDTIARIGGDEFIVLLPGLQKPEDCVTIAKKIILALSSPFFIERHELYVTVSIGISFYPHDGKDAHTLIKHADHAMYQAKEQGRNNYQMYSSSRQEHSPEMLSMEVGLRRAIQNEELTVHYQPQFNSLKQELIGLEALVRWHHPEWGLVPPSQFIPLAEETGLIASLDQWVLREACMQLRRWLDEGYAPVRISVNLSMLQFRQPNLSLLISKALTEAGVPPYYLEIELTESTVMSNPDLTLRTLNELKDMGVRISLDDFGVGYSSLHYLKKLPIHTIKIDQSFVRDIPQKAEDTAIVQTIIDLSQNLKIGVIAEGVENEEQLLYLQNHQCEDVQGFLYSKPLPKHEVTRFLRKASDRSSLGDATFVV